MRQHGATYSHTTVRGTEFRSSPVRELSFKNSLRNSAETISGRSGLARFNVGIEVAKIARPRQNDVGLQSYRQKRMAAPGRVVTP